MVPLLRPNTCEFLPVPCEPGDFYFFPLWPMGMCKLLALCERRGLVLSLALLVSSNVLRINTQPLQMVSFSLWAPSSQFLYPAHSGTSLTSPVPSCLFNSVKSLNSFRFLLPTLWSKDSFLSSLGTTESAFLSLFSRITALCYLFLNVWKPLFHKLSLIF